MKAALLPLHHRYSWKSRKIETVIARFVGKPLVVIGYCKGICVRILVRSRLCAVFVARHLPTRAILERMYKHIAVRSRTSVHAVENVSLWNPTLASTKSRHAIAHHLLRPRRENLPPLAPVHRDCSSEMWITILRIVFYFSGAELWTMILIPKYE